MALVKEAAPMNAAPLAMETLVNEADLTNVALPATVTPAREDALMIGGLRRGPLATVTPEKGVDPKIVVPFMTSTKIPELEPELRPVPYLSPYSL